MALIVHSIASGSSGNSILVSDGGSSLLIDAGVSARRIVSALARAQVSTASLRAVLITHEHWDHTSGAAALARKFNVPLVSNAATLAATPEADQVPTRVLDVGEEMTVGDLHVTSFPVSHDAVSPVGYTVASTEATVCSATDTGVVTPALGHMAKLADLLILESNHDLEMLRNGPYHWLLKQRILGENGHLSNAAASALLLDLAAEGRRLSVWLAHLSRTNNRPAIALAAARATLSGLPGSQVGVAVARRGAPSLWWRSAEKTLQLSLFSTSR